MLSVPFVLPGTVLQKTDFFVVAIGFTFGLDFSTILSNKRKNLEPCKISAAQGLDQIQSHFIKGLHLVRLSKFTQVSPHHCISSIALNLKLDVCLLCPVTYPSLFSLWT